MDRVFTRKTLAGIWSCDTMDGIDTEHLTVIDMPKYLLIKVISLESIPWTQKEKEETH